MWLIWFPTRLCIHHSLLFNKGEASLDTHERSSKDRNKKVVDQTHDAMPIAGQFISPQASQDTSSNIHNNNNRI
jgi:hypothetical protein